MNTRTRSWLRKVLPGVTAVAICGTALTATATPVLTLDLRLDESAIAAGGEVDFPLYLVENRSPSEASPFDGWRRIDLVYSALTSTQSRFVSFTPATGFAENHIFVSDSLITFSVKGQNGITMPRDNTGIDGRSEILIATVRIEIGEPIPQDDGIGLPDPDLLLEVGLSNDPQSGDNVQAIIDDGQTYKSFGGMSPRTIQYFRPEVVNPPVVTVSGPSRFTVKTATALVRGTASGDAGVARVVIAASTGAEYPATGTTSWRRSVPLKMGWNQFYVYAVDHAEISSAYSELMIRRDKPKRKKPRDRR